MYISICLLQYILPTGSYRLIDSCVSRSFDTSESDEAFDRSWQLKSWWNLMKYDESLNIVVWCCIMLYLDVFSREISCSSFIVALFYLVLIDPYLEYSTDFCCIPVSIFQSEKFLIYFIGWPDAKSSHLLSHAGDENQWPVNQWGFPRIEMIKSRSLNTLQPCLKDHLDSSTAWEKSSEYHRIPSCNFT